MQKIYGPPAFQRPSGGMYLLANQLNIVNTSITVVQLDRIDDFLDSIENTVTFTITPGIAGLYLITGQVTYMNIVADKEYRALVDYGGATHSATVHSSHDGLLSVSVTFFRYLTNISPLTLRAWHNAGVNTIDIEGAANAGYKRTFLHCQRVR